MKVTPTASPCAPGLAHAPVDRNIPLIHVGDRVRIVGLSDLSDISPEALAETLHVFQFLMRKYKTPS